MELKHIKELMSAMERTGTKRLTLKKDNFELTLERDETLGFRASDYLPETLEESLRDSQTFSRTDQALSRGSEMPANRASSPVSTEPLKEEVANAKYITSPMVGTFYTSPSPEDPSFVKPGDKIDKNSVVCIIEAMKVMNEIKANMTGTIAEILVDSGQPVEFGTKLFRIIE